MISVRIRTFVDYMRIQIIIECQKQDDYQESLRWLIAFIEEYAKHGREMGGKGKEGVTTITKVFIYTLFRFSLLIRTSLKN
jgi:Family of unknown function (DUF5923)